VTSGNIDRLRSRLPTSSLRDKFNTLSRGRCSRGWWGLCKTNKSKQKIINMELQEWLVNLKENLRSLNSWGEEYARVKKEGLVSTLKSKMACPKLKTLGNMKANKIASEIQETLCQTSTLILEKLITSSNCHQQTRKDGQIRKMKICLRVDLPI